MFNLISSKLTSTK